MGLVKDFIIVVLGLWLAMFLYPFVWVTCKVVCKINERGEACKACMGWWACSVIVELRFFKVII